MVVIIRFQNEMRASFLGHLLCAGCHLARLGTEHSTKLGVKSIGNKTSHSDYLGFCFVLFVCFLIGVGGEGTVSQREGVCTKDLETLWKLMTSRETAFSHAPDL